MARIEEKIAEIADPALRKIIGEEVAKLKKHTRFGLVFEEHQPEVVPVYGRRIKRHERVAKKVGNLTEIWLVLSVKDGQAHCKLEKGGSAAAGTRETFPVDQLVAIRSMGEPIYPSLTPVDSVSNGDPSAPHHVLIEADNYHALQLLLFSYEGKVDCIYIDPPYNTGARDWKYNNDYVDKNDQWQHSKWLTFMVKRLRLAERLLKPNGVLIVTIDEHEVNNLGLLLKQTLLRAREIQMVTIVMNTAGSLSPGKFSRAEEYAFFCFYGTSKPVPMRTDLLSDTASNSQFWFPLFRSRGLNDRPSKRANLVYPVAIDPETLLVVGTGPSLKQRVLAGQLAGDLDAWRPDPTESFNGYPVVWPVLDSGEVSTWQVASTSLMKLQTEGFVRVRKSTNEDGPRAFSIQYVKSGNRKKVLSGEVEVIGREPSGTLILQGGARSSVPKSTWKVANHDARQYGTTMLRDILGATSFTYPKSPYATADALRSVMSDRPDALILDFFAGSGTSLQSTLILNNEDGGQRRCILVTNNEVPNEALPALSELGLNPGDAGWEKIGICRSVTWPRSKFTLLGKRDDGTVLTAEYLTGKMKDLEKARKFFHIGFVDPSTLLVADDSTEKQRKDANKLQKQVVAIIDGLPQSLVKGVEQFIVSPDHKASVLFDSDKYTDWLEALDDQEHITEFYIVAPTKKLFELIKLQVIDLLGNISYQEEEKRSLADGFPANLEYFKLDFLDPQEVQMGRQFAAILPVLWMMAGSCGPLPDAPDAHAPWLLPDSCPFVVLMQETRFKEFVLHVESRSDLTHVFIVTNSLDSVHKLRHEWPDLQVVQLYKDYLENFRINLSEKPAQ